MNSHNIFEFPFGEIYTLYLSKIPKKGRTEQELRQVITWLTGYSEEELNIKRTDDSTMKNFFTSAPQLQPNRTLITGTICGTKLQDIVDPLMLEIRYLDKLVDEIAKGKVMEKIFRKRVINMHPKKELLQWFETFSMVKRRIF